MNIEVSVVIPSYNYGEYIQQAIDSVLGQKDVCVDVVVVDDGSTDNTLDILRAYGSKIRWFCQENAGVSAARNLGIEKAEFDLIAFLDADDWMLENSLYKRCSYLIEHSEYDWVYCRWKIANNDGEIVGTSQEYFPHPEGVLEGDVFPALFRKYGGMHIITPVFRRADVRAVGGFNVNYKAIEDYDFLLRMARGRNVGVCLDTYSAVQRLHHSHLSPNPDFRLVAELDMLAQYRTDKEALGYLQYPLKDRIANLYNLLACVYCGKKKWVSCLRACVLSALNKPMQFFAYRVFFYMLTGRVNKIAQMHDDDLIKRYACIVNDEQTDL